MAAETSQTLDRGLRVLEVVAEAPDGLTVSELAAALGIGRTVVYRLVVTLEHHALIRRGPDGRCRLGLGLLAMGRQVQPVVRDTALPALRLLAEAVGATAVLTIVDGQEAQDCGTPWRLARVAARFLRRAPRLAVRSIPRGWCPMMARRVPSGSPCLCWACQGWRQVSVCWPCVN